MKSLFKLARYLLIIGTGPALVAIGLIVFYNLYWGIGLISIGLSLFTVFIIATTTLLSGYIVRNKKLNFQIGIPSIIAIAAGSAIFLIQKNNTNQEDLKSVFLENDASKKYELLESKVNSIAFEYEVYLQLKSTSELTSEFLKSRNFQVVTEKPEFEYSTRPDWFPEYDPTIYKAYEFTDYQKEENYTVLVTLDQKTIYAAYLAY